MAAVALAAGLLRHEGLLQHEDEPWSVSAAQRTSRVVDFTNSSEHDPRLAQSSERVWHYTWATDPDETGREQLWQSRRTLELVDARPGMRIVDVGAGGGWFTFRFASLVGPTGMVTATDADLRMVRLLAYERRRRGLQNVRVLHVPYDVLGVPPASADVVVMVGLGVLHSEEPGNDPATVRRYVAQVANALRPGGRFVYAAAFEDDPSLTRTGAEAAALCAEWFDREVLEEQPPEQNHRGGRPLVGFILSLRRR